MKFKIVFITIFFSITNLTNCAAVLHKDQYEELFSEVRKEQNDEIMKEAFQEAWRPVNYIKCKLLCGCFVEFSNLHNHHKISVFYKSLLDFYQTKHECKNRTVNQIIPVTPVSKGQQKPTQGMNAEANLVQYLPEKNDKPEHVKITIDED